MSGTFDEPSEGINQMAVEAHGKHDRLHVGM